MRGLQTDLYQLTMAAGYFEAAKTQEVATFELFVRRLPPNRSFLIFAGLQQAVEYLLQLRFTGEEIAYLRGLPVFANASPGFWDYLRGFRFEGDVFAMREGTPFFAGEPVMNVRARLIEAQIPETHLLAVLSFQSMIASKAVRVLEAAAGRSVVEFGTRRAHSAEAGVMAGRAAYIGGCIGTSNVETGFRFGVPVFGTAAHSWVMAFGNESASYRALQKLLGERTTYLIDTYDTVEGARRAAELGLPLWGVRIDSGNLGGLAHEVRQVLDAAGLRDAKIMASGDLQEDRIRDLVGSGAPIDAFGVGTELATSSDAPNLPAVYKLAQIEIGGIKRFTFKLSAEKKTWPAAKQVFRYADRDVIGCTWECPMCPAGAEKSEPLLRPVIVNGHVIEELPPASEARERCKKAIADLKPDHRVEYSQELQELEKRVRQSV